AWPAESNSSTKPPTAHEVQKDLLELHRAVQAQVAHLRPVAEVLDLVTPFIHARSIRAASFVADDQLDDVARLGVEKLDLAVQWWLQFLWREDVDDDHVHSLANQPKNALLPVVLGVKIRDQECDPASNGTSAVLSHR